jgi:hypothetical protein
MNNILFTVEEENLICAFNTSNRIMLTADIRDALPHFDGEPDMTEIAVNVLRKLESITDAEFTKFIFTPAYDDESEV